MTEKTDRRYPFTSFPEGWFYICHSDELKNEEIKPVSLLGKNLILMRNAEGTPYLYSAYCPHQGAHIGFGGKISKHHFTCPFHGWNFNFQGKCVSKAYNDKVSDETDFIRSYAVCEIDRKIFFFHNREEKIPFLNLPEVPEYSDPEWIHIQKSSWKFKSHIQEIAENLVDAVHFETLHRTSYPDTVFTPEGRTAIISSRLKLYTRKGEEKDALLNSRGYGPGYWILKYEGIVDTIAVVTITPIDQEYLNFNFEFLIRGNEALGKKFTDSIIKEVEADIIIWENKKYRSRPLLENYDGPVMEFRTWFSQFLTR